MSFRFYFSNTSVTERGLVGVVWLMWFGWCGLVGVVWLVWFGWCGLVDVVWLMWFG